VLPVRKPIRSTPQCKETPEPAGQPPALAIIQRDADAGHGVDNHRPIENDRPMGKGPAPPVKHEIPRPCRRGNLNCVSRDDAQIPLSIAVQMPIRRVMIDPEIRYQPRRPVNRRRQHRTIHPSVLAHRRMMIGRPQPGFSLGHDGGALSRNVRHATNSMVDRQ
jgi:hypothetical protein